MFRIVLMNEKRAQQFSMGIGDSNRFCVKHFPSCEFMTDSMVSLRVGSNEKKKKNETMRQPMLMPCQCPRNIYSIFTNI